MHKKGHPKEIIVGTCHLTEFGSEYYFFSGELGYFHINIQEHCLDTGSNVYIESFPFMFIRMLCITNLQATIFNILWL